MDLSARVMDRFAICTIDFKAIGSAESSRQCLDQAIDVLHVIEHGR
jgi:hypothetical protein